MYNVRITLSLDDQLVKKARKIALEGGTTVTGLIRDYLQELASENEVPGRKRLEVEALEHSFQQLQVRVGKQTWTRDELHDRSQADR
jgi:antitoxin component of RelBE/YafQ-DinJ toxin-antitoxin module